MTDSFDLSNPNVKPIEFAEGDPAVGTLMTISGWGATKEVYNKKKRSMLIIFLSFYCFVFQSGQLSTLRAADVPIFDRKRCDDIISNLHPRFMTEGIVTERLD